MLRRLSCFALALAFAASSVFSSSAWSADSFISGGEEYEPSSDVAISDDLPVPDVYAAPRRAPRMVKVSAADQASAETGTTGKLVVPATLPTSVEGPIDVLTKHYTYSKTDIPNVGKFVLESDIWDSQVFSAPYSPQFVTGFPAVWYNSFAYTPSLANDDDKTRGLAALCTKDSPVHPPWYINNNGQYTGVDKDTGFSFVNTYDVSSYNSSAFSLDGIDTWFLFCNGPYWPSWTGVSKPVSVDVLVDGQQFLSLTRGASNYIDFGGYVFSGASKISTISFRWHLPFLYFVSDNASYAGDYTFLLRTDVSPTAANALTISFLDGQDVINAQNDKTKSDINNHEEYESQWTGSMTDNFNALGFSDFSWSDSLVSGFSLFSGIFMDIWRALGGATILFTFPLLLGIALLLVGRISRSGGRSGSGKGGGDGG